MTILTYLQKLLDESDQPCALMEPNDDFPYERLLIALESAAPNQGDLLEVTVHPQYFEGAFTNENRPDSYYLLQFQYVLPLEVLPDTFNQVSSSLHFFNRLLHCPGFELDELSDRVIYRYVWFIKKHGIDAFLLKQVIGNIQFCFNMFSIYIKEIAEGLYTLEEILEKVTHLKTHFMQNDPSSSKE
jgi:hypothetical protein